MTPLSLALAATLASLAFQSAFAQEAASSDESDPAELDVVEVTGSRIPRAQD
jgi:hypothetical protein